MLQGGTTAPGDSGSPIIGDKSNGLCKVYGILGGNQHTNLGDFVFYTPYKYIKAAGFTVNTHSHSYSYRDYNGTYNRCTCNGCGYSYLQKHSTTWDYSSACCAACGHR